LSLRPAKIEFSAAKSARSCIPTTRMSIVPGVRNAVPQTKASASIEAQSV